MMEELSADDFKFSISDLKINNENMFVKAKLLAEKIMKNYEIHDLDNKPHRITSLEFYLFHKNHEDISTDCNIQQLTFGQFYINHFTKNYKRSRIDITCGNKEERIYGGILIKQLDYKMSSGHALATLLGKCCETRIWKNFLMKIIEIHDSCDIFNGKIKLVPRTPPLNTELKWKPREIKDIHLDESFKKLNHQFYALKDK